MGNRVKEIRESRKMTQEELSKESGVSRVTIALIENGTTKNASSKTLLKLAKALGVTIDLFFTASV